MKTLLIILFSLSIAFVCDAQKIALNDHKGSSHAIKVEQVIRLFSDAEIVPYWFSSGITTNDDSISISNNSYIASGSFLLEEIYEQFDRLHVFAVMNDSLRVRPCLINYSENILSVGAATDSVILNKNIHPKVDVVFPNSIGVSGSTATSFNAPAVTGAAVGQISNSFIKQFIEAFNYAPSAMQTKAAVINSRDYKKFLDTALLSQQYQYLIYDSLEAKASDSYKVLLDAFYDSVKVTITYLDRAESFELEDTLLFNNQKTQSTVYQETFYNTSHIDIDVSCELCDSLYTTFTVSPLVDYYYDTVSIVVLSDSSVFVLNNDTVCCSYENEIDSPYQYVAIGFGRGFQYDTVQVRWFEFENDTIQGNDLSLFIGDTLTLLRTVGNFLGWDTTFFYQKNVVRYAIAYMPLGKQIVQTPVDIISFSATQIEDYAQLEIKVEQEINVDKYVFKKSYNGVQFYDFQTVGAIGANGYRANDLIDSEITYYQVHAVDHDGTITKSEVIVLVYDEYKEEISRPEMYYNILGQRVGKNYLLNTFKY